MVNIVCFAGSSRKSSFNSSVVKVAADAAEKNGSNITLIDLKDYELPLYNQDLEVESGIPENALKLKEIFKKADGFLIASPEYNSSLTPLMKNTIDWLSRQGDDQNRLEAFSGKYAGVMSASPGGLGGIRALPHFRLVLEGLGVTVIPNQTAVASAMQVFDDKGNIIDKAKEKAIRSIGIDLSNLLKKIKGN